MKKVVSGLFIAFLLVVHFSIMIVALYDVVVKSPSVELYTLFLFTFATIGFINDITFCIVLCWPSRLVYSCFKSYFFISFYLYVGLHFIGVGYLAYLVSSTENYKDELAFRIYIFYLIIDCAVFYGTFKLLKSVIKDSKKSALEENKKTNKLRTE